jgi:hypothetical protein
MADDMAKLIEVARKRSKTEEGFRNRLNPIVGVLADNMIDRHVRDVAIGAAGLALHMDDVAAGRYPIPSTEGWDS